MHADGDVALLDVQQPIPGIPGLQITGATDGVCKGLLFGPNGLNAP